MAWEENSRICLNMQLIAILSRIGVEYAEESDTYTDACLCLEVFKLENHEIDEEEDSYAHKHEREVEVAPVALLVVQFVYNSPCDEYQNDETYNHQWEWI